MLFNDVAKLYDQSPQIDEWYKSFIPDEKYYYASGVARQVEVFKAVNTIYGGS